MRVQIEQILDAATARGLRTGENPAGWRGHLENLLSRHEKKEESSHMVRFARWDEFDLESGR
ncbi:hypothetical protein [Pseudomonas syringae]|uniref:hypothetical protein n=1 Tax=Pseudomonas syringae TaxID=317 RepID=UPI003BB70018